MPKTDFDYPRFEELKTETESDCPEFLYEQGEAETHLFDDQNLFEDAHTTRLDRDIPTYVKARINAKQTVRFYPDFDRSSGRYIYAVDDPEHWANYRSYRYGAEVLRTDPHTVTSAYVSQYGNLEWYTPRYMSFDHITYQDTLLDQPQAHVDRVVNNPELGLFYPVSDEFLAKYKAGLLAKRHPYRFDWPREFDEYGEEEGFPIVGLGAVFDEDITERVPALDNYDYFLDQEYTHMRYLWNWLDRATLTDPVAMAPPTTPEDREAMTFPSLADTLRSQLTVAESKVQNIRRMISFLTVPEDRYHTFDYDRPFDMWSTHRQKDAPIEQLCYELSGSEYLTIHPEYSHFPIAVFDDPDCEPVAGFPDGNHPAQFNLTVVRLDRNVEHYTVFADTKDEALAQIIGTYYAAAAVPVRPIGEHYLDTHDRIEELVKTYTNRVEFARMVGTPDLVKQYDPVWVGLEEIDTIDYRVLDTHALEVDRWQSIVVGASPYEQPRVDGEASYPWGQVFDADPLEDRQFEFDTFDHLRMDIPNDPDEVEPVQTQIESYHIVLPFSIRHEYMDSEVEMDSGRMLDSSAYSFHSWNDEQHPIYPGNHFPPEKCSLKQWFAKARPETINELHPNVFYDGYVPVVADTLRRPIIEVTRVEDVTEELTTSLLPEPAPREHDHAPSFAAFNPFDDDHFGVRDYLDHAPTDFVDETFGNGMEHIYKDMNVLDLNQAEIPSPTFDPETLTFNTDALMETLEGERRLDGEKVSYGHPEILQPHQEQSTFLIAPVWIEITRIPDAPIIAVDVDAAIIAVDADGATIEVDTDPPILEVERIIE